MRSEGWVGWIGNDAQHPQLVCWADEAKLDAAELGLRPGVVGNRLVVLTLLPIGDATAVISLGVIGIESNGPGELGNGRIEILLL